MAHFKCKVETNKTKEPKKKHPKFYGRRKRTKVGIVRGGENTVGPLHLQSILMGIHAESTRALLCLFLMLQQKVFQEHWPCDGHHKTSAGDSSKHTQACKYSAFCEGPEHFYDAGSNAPWTPGEKKTHCNEAKVVRHFRS